MADLSGVLRKTIDGLPRATPQMRAKVYEKARAAIQRQIQAANPPIAPEVAEARMNALEDAIDRTEAHYVDLESGAVQESDLGPQAAPPEPQTQPIAPETAPPVAAERPSPSDIAPPEPSHEPAPEPYVPDTPSGGPAMHSAWGAARDPEDEPAYAKPARDEPMADRPGDNWGASRGAHWDEESETREGAAAGPGWGADMQGSRGASEPPVFRPAEPDETSHAPVGVAGPFVPSSASAGAAMADYGHDDRRTDEREFDRDETEPDLEHQGHDDADRHAPIPAADISAPRYSPPRGGAAGRRKGSGAAVGIVSLVVVVAGLGAAAFFYGDEIASLVTGEPVVASGDGAGTTTGTGEAASQGEADVAGAASGEAGGTDAGTRRFTQRLLPDGTEVDEGPATPEPNAFGEGTNVAAANAIEPDATDGTSPTIAAEIGENPQIVGGEDEAATGEAPTEAGSETAAAPEASENGAIPVAQRTVFYQERTADTPGTQETGNVVWSVVEEPPIEGQPPEPAIRAVAEVPDENLTLTMTIRRNADPTLPASHVIELLFDTPAGFPGGSVATVQRLALKPTEQARGEPLIGVAGKISDGFFIIALNNLDQAVQNNLSLLESEQWIDIPIAYATGRRALVSIEKGIPGDRAFKEAIAAWDAKT